MSAWRNVRSSSGSSVDFQMTQPFRGIFKINLSFNLIDLSCQKGCEFFSKFSNPAPQAALPGFKATRRNGLRNFVQAFLTRAFYWEQRGMGNHRLSLKTANFACYYRSLSPGSMGDFQYSELELCHHLSFIIVCRNKCPVTVLSDTLSNFHAGFPFQIPFGESSNVRSWSLWLETLKVLHKLFLLLEDVLQLT